MQRSDSPLNKLFDAARQEHSPLSEDDVRALLNEPQKKNRSPIMLPMLLAGVVITIAGITSSVVLRQDDSSTKAASTQQTSQDSRQTATTSASTTASTTASAIATTSSDASVTTHKPTASVKKVGVTTRLISENDPAAPVWWEGEADVAKSNLCNVKVFPCVPLSKTGKSPKVYFATLTANREVTDRLAGVDGPTPVLCTDVKGRACSATDVAYFASNYNAIAGDLNDLVPVTYAGREDILAWYKPSAELVQAFPDSLQDELVTLLDIDIDFEIHQPEMITLPCGEPSGTKFTDSAMQKTLGISIYGQDADTKTMHIQMNGLDSTMKNIEFKFDGNFDSIAAIMRQFGASTYTDMTALQNYEELLKDPHMLATLSNMDSAMKFMQIESGTDSLNTLRSEMRKYYGVKPDSLPSKNIYMFKKNILVDPSVGDGSSIGKQRVRSRVIIKSNTKRNKKAQVLPSVERLSELTPTSSGAITSTTVFPNPATNGGATMSYVLNEPRTLTLTLLDLNGTVVATMVQESKRASGAGQIAFPLNNIPAGMYLVTLMSDKGERAMQRLVVQ